MSAKHPPAPLPENGAASAEPQAMDLRTAIQRAYAHWNAGQAQQAEHLARRILETVPGQIDALHLLGLIAHAYKHPELAAQFLREACRDPRTPAPYLSNSAEILRQQGLLTEAEALARRATEGGPQLPMTWNNLGIILQEMGRYPESVACLERVVALQPDNPEAHNNLGNTHKRAGRLADARVEYGHALRLHPNYAEAHSNLAFLLKDLGEYAAAAASAQQAIDCNPRLADAYINLAGVESARQRLPQALQALDALLTIAPDHAGALVAKSRVLNRSQRHAAALETARQAATLAPTHADAINALGEAQQATDLFDDALASFERAMALPGVAHESASVNRAQLLTIVGRSTTARDAFDAVLARYPANTKAWLGLADMIRFEAGDPRIGAMENLLAGGGQRSPEESMELRFALAKAYMDIGDVEHAWPHLSEGNRLKRASLDFDIQAAERQVARIAQAYADPTPAHPPVGHPSDMPVFIVGMPRSGTTLVEQILASHSQVHGAGELPVLAELVGRHPGFPESLAGADARTLHGLGADYVAAVQARAQGKRHVVDKMPGNFLHAGLIRHILPNARIIHCRRNPVDTCLSCYTKLFGAEQNFTYDLAELGRVYRAYDALMARWRAVMPADRFLEVDYEAVVTHPEAQTRRLIEFLGLDWEDACLRYYDSVRPVRTASLNQVRQPVYRHARGRWLPYAHHLGPLLAELGELGEAKPR